jgi:hypothetical protein
MRLVLAAAVKLALASGEARAQPPSTGFTKYVDDLVASCITEVRLLHRSSPEFDAYLKDLDSEGTATWVTFGTELERFKFNKCMKTRDAIPSPPDYQAPKGATK